MRSGIFRRLILLQAIAGFWAAASNQAAAQKTYDVGATDDEIKIGSIVPYSGPVSAYGIIGKVQAAYFKSLNEEGGINGRKVNYISYDDAYSPPKTVEQARKLVESDEVLLLFDTFGAPTSSAVHKYLNSKKVPQLFVASGATKWGDYRNFPWTMGYQPPYQGEGRVYATYILKEKPDAKIAVLYQNDDFGKDLLKGLRNGLGAKSSMIVEQLSYEVTEPTIESLVVKLKASGADTFVSFASQKFTAQAIKKIGELGWKPLQFVNGVGISVTQVMKPAGFENAQGILSATYAKDPSDPRWRNDAGMRAYYRFLEKYVPDANPSDSIALYGYGAAQTMRKVLELCGDNLTRENVMKQASSLKGFANDALLPGISINTGPNDFYPIKQLQMMRFKGENWELFGEILSGEVNAE